MGEDIVNAVFLFGAASFVNCPLTTLQAWFSSCSYFRGRRRSFFFMVGTIDRNIVEVVVVADEMCVFSSVVVGIDIFILGVILWME